MVEPSVKTARGMGPLFKGGFFLPGVPLPGILARLSICLLKECPITWTYAIEKESLRFERWSMSIS